MRGLALVGLMLLALLSLTSTFAMQNGTVSGSAMSIAVVNTNTALLSLAPGSTGAGSSNISKTAYYKSDPTADTLLLDFRKGRGYGNTFGFAAKDGTALATQNNVYEYRSLFSVTNNSAVQQCVVVYVPGGGVTNLAQIRVGGTEVAKAGGVESACYPLSPASSAAVDIRWEISSTSAIASGTFSLRVETRF